MTAVRWESTDSDTADLLSVLADDGTIRTDREWTAFVNALFLAAETEGGVVRPNTLRPMVRNHVKPNRIGAFTRRALLENLIEQTGDWQVSDDTGSRNGGKPARVYRWIGGVL